MDEGEDPRQAVLRELAEEIGTDRAEILAEHPEWLTYDLPEHLVGKALGGKWRGQKQRWFALRFTGRDEDIRLDADPHPEFDAWRWVPLADIPRLIVPFKRPIYEVLARDFARFAVAV
jgi:putative (di)nucleoside polyphosphate hydrolase